MASGHDERLFILAFDHRGSLKEHMFGIRGREPDPAEFARLADAKLLVWRASRRPWRGGSPRGSRGADR